MIFKFFRTFTLFMFWFVSFTQTQRWTKFYASIYIQCKTAQWLIIKRMLNWIELNKKILNIPNKCKLTGSVSFPIWMNTIKNKNFAMEIQQQSSTHSRIQCLSPYHSYCLSLQKTRKCESQIINVKFQVISFNESLNPQVALFSLNQ